MGYRLFFRAAVAPLLQLLEEEKIQITQNRENLTIDNLW